MCTHQQLLDVKDTRLPRGPSTVATPRIDLDDVRVFTDIEQVTERIAQSKRFDSCFARQYFRHSFQRGESLTLGAWALRTLDDAARAGSMEDALAAVASLRGLKGGIVP